MSDALAFDGFSPRFVPKHRLGCHVKHGLQISVAEFAKNSDGHGRAVSARNL
ncbi:hypothetical protein RESH_00598 [Rhodopirellula europaea SH398]|uniref:Uncharacterized protein n=1 Tax=Rhodopirellula europaea SH398 TaxID=1263868 RepID=M5SM44_9BACT|nr:hypothetical protein RESH_00598 [Rhodopirellula europaea SH398]